MRVLLLAIAVAVLVAWAERPIPRGAQTSHSQHTLRCAGVSVRIVAGWHGRVRRGRGGFFTLTLASFPLVAESDAVNERSAKRMSRDDVLVLLIAYGRNQAEAAAFTKHVRLPLTVERMTVYRMFEHLPAGHRLARVLFRANGGLYDVQVQFARMLTARLRRRADSSLRLMLFSAPPRQSQSGPTRC